MGRRRVLLDVVDDQVLIPSPQRILHRGERPERLREELHLQGKIEQIVAPTVVPEEIDADLHVPKDMLPLRIVRKGRLQARPNRCRRKPHHRRFVEIVGQLPEETGPVDRHALEVVVPLDLWLQQLEHQVLHHLEGEKGRAACRKGPAQPVCHQRPEELHRSARQTAQRRDRHLRPGAPLRTMDLPLIRQGQSTLRHQHQDPVRRYPLRQQPLEPVDTHRRLACARLPAQKDLPSSGRLEHRALLLRQSQIQILGHLSPISAPLRSTECQAPTALAGAHP